MNKDDIIRMAQEVGLLDYRDDWSSVPDEYRECISDFAALVAAAERRKHQADIEHWKGAAVTAEKWRGMAMSRDGDGRTVQAVQAEAREWEREACAKVCEARYMGDNNREDMEAKRCAEAIRARSDK